MPEVETMVKWLQRWVGYSVAAADGRHERYLPGNERVFATDQRINGIFRRGKFIVFMLEHGALLCHNAMSGYWDSDDDRWTFDYVEGERTSRDSDIRASLLLCPAGEILSEKGRNIYFHDARKFGSLRYLEPEALADKLSDLGPEALESAHMYEPAQVMDTDEFCKRMHNKKPVKALLMEQDRIAGVGNIYAAEALWKAHISPKRPGHELTEQERVNLYEAVKSVLRDALARRLDYDGLKIYRRKVCPDCGSPTQEEEVKGRNTWWCPCCQK